MAEEPDLPPPPPPGDASRPGLSLIGAHADEETIWRRVLELAARGRFTTSPNPRVGAVVVDASGEVVGEGFHDRAGSPHAEPAALAAAGERARGGTVYLNLEPCAHHGRTPPCAHALAEARVGRVRYSLEDPDPRTSGKGGAYLREHGVAVEVGGAAEAAERVNEAFLTSARLGRPFVHLKWAATLDGKTAAATGESKWITGEEARHDALRLREECDAVLVGAGTILADDPFLTRRLGRNRALVAHRRVVVDGALRVSPDFRIFDTKAGDTWLATARPDFDRALAPFRARGVHVLSLPASDGGVDLAGLLAALHAVEVRSVLVEGGGETAWRFLAAGLADRVTAYVAPALLGGRAAPTPLGGEGAALGSRVPIRDLELERLGDDVRMTGRLAGAPLPRPRHEGT